jgi:hypothetical protein
MQVFVKCRVKGNKNNDTKNVSDEYQTPIHRNGNIGSTLEQATQYGRV